MSAWESEAGYRFRDLPGGVKVRVESWKNTGAWKRYLTPRNDDVADKDFVWLEF
jgi:hypothetical protein